MSEGIPLKGEPGDISDIISFVATTWTERNVIGKLIVVIVTQTMSR
jgi:hypothetical protein